jgi:hypothetical protein
MRQAMKKTANPWTSDEVARLRKLAKENTPTRVIGMKLGRSESSVRSKAQSIKLSLKPVNQSPYGIQP